MGWNPIPLPEDESWTQDRQRRERLEREAQIARGSSPPPKLTQEKDVFSEFEEEETDDDTTTSLNIPTISPISPQPITCPHSHYHRDCTYTTPCAFMPLRPWTDCRWHNQDQTRQTYQREQQSHTKRISVPTHHTTATNVHRKNQPTPTTS